MESQWEQQGTRDSVWILPSVSALHADFLLSGKCVLKTSPTAVAQEGKETRSEAVTDVTIKGPSALTLQAHTPIL